MPGETHTCDDCEHCKLKTKHDGTFFRFPPSAHPVPGPHNPGVFDDVVWLRPAVALSEPKCGEFKRAQINQRL